MFIRKKGTSDTKKNATFLRKWENFKSEKWGYECLVCLKDIKRYLEKARIGTVPKVYIDIVQNYYAEEWPDKAGNLKFKFSKSYVKEYKKYTQYNELSISKIEMLTGGLIVPFFKKNKLFYNNYIEWMQDIENFFRIYEKDKMISFQYSEQEYKSVKECVNAYNDFREFDSKSFYDFIKELILILEFITKSRQNQEIVIDEKLDDIRKDIDNFYQELFLYSEDTIGILKEEIDNMFWTSANDVIESYIFAKEKEN